MKNSNTQYTIHNTQYRLSRRARKGFTLVEALIAMSILIIGIISGFILITRALYSTAVIQDRLTVSFLAQEGVELVRQIRDSNFVKILDGKSVSWRDGLANGRYIIESKAGTEESIKLVSITTEKGPDFLYDNNLKMYNYSMGEPTTFNREIKISAGLSDDEIRVEVIMNWQTKKINFDLTVEDHLYNWLKL